MNARYYEQALDEGRNGVFDVFELKIQSSLKIIGFERYGLISYFIDSPRPNQAYVCVILSNIIQNCMTSFVDSLTQGSFEVLEEYCPKFAQHLKDGKERRFDRAGLVCVNGRWHLWKQITYHKVSTELIDLITEDIVLELMERMNQIIKELNDWDGFSASDYVKIALKDGIRGYKYVKKFISITNAIDNI